MRARRWSARSEYAEQPLSSGRVRRSRRRSARVAASAYRLATPVIRRMSNQALFQQILILDDEITEVLPGPRVSAIEDVAGRPRVVRKRRETRTLR